MSGGEKNFIARINDAQNVFFGELQFPMLTIDPSMGRLKSTFCLTKI